MQISDWDVMVKKYRSWYPIGRRLTRPSPNLLNESDRPNEEIARSLNVGRAGAGPVPIAVVCVVREYESWFLASVASVVGGVTAYTGNPESTVNPKETLKQLLPRRNYRETEHQAKLTALIDLDAASKNSRSFRRLRHAVEELVDALDANIPMVSPGLGS